MNTNTNKLLLQLDWNWFQVRSDEAAEEHYNADFSDDEKDVFRCHLFEIDHMQLPETCPKHYHDDRVPCDPRNGKIYPNFFIDSTKSPAPKLFSKFTCKSKLKSNEHKACIRAITRVQTQFQNIFNNQDQLIPKLMDPNERKDLETFTRTFVTRQKEQKDFLEFVQQHFMSDYANLVERVNPYLLGFVKDKWKRSFLDAKFGRTGQYILQTAISLESGISEEVVLSIGEIITQTGRIYGYSKLPKLVHPTTRQLETLDLMTPTFTSNISTSQIIANKANVVLSLAVLRQLIDHPTNEEGFWMIPFRIVGHDINNEFQKTCIFDDPLPSVNWSIQEQNREAIRSQVRACTIAQKTCVSYCLKERQYCQHSSVEKTFSNNSHIDESLEYKLVSLDEFLSKQRNVEHAEAHRAELPQILRVANLNDGSSEQIRMIIRLYPNAFEASNIDGSPTLVNISIKLEYQPHFGAEQMTASELINEWCTLVLQPGSVSYRYRITAESGHIMSVVRLTQTLIESEMLRLHKIRPNILLQRLHQILCTISRLPPDNYLLRHTRQHGKKVMVYSQNDDKLSNGLDFNKLYAEDAGSASYDRISWTPIDDMEVTQVHRNASVAPCTFPYNDNFNERSKFASMPKVLNDRKLVLARAKKKLIERQLIAAAKKRQRFKKKIGKNVKKSKTQKKLSASMDCETIDPYLVFDAQGNMMVSELMSTSMAAKTSTVETSKTSNITQTLEPDFCYTTYVKQANISSELFK